MRSLARLLRLSFLPISVDLGLLLLRLWVALPMLVLHGWGKLAGFAERSSRFADPFGIGPMPSLALAISSEVFGSILLVLGLFSRLAALAGIVTMSVAFLYAHGGRLTGPGNGELPFVFLGGYVVLFLAGPGRFSIDARGGRR